MKTKDDIFSLVRKMYKEKSYPIEKLDTNYGDEYYSENGVEYLFEIDGYEYGVGYNHVIENADDWAQSESHSNEWIHKYTDDGFILEYVKPDAMWDLLIVNKRDYIIESFSFKN